MLRALTTYLIYMAGVAFMYWHYETLKSSLDIVSLLLFAGFFLFGISRFATIISAKIPK